MFRLCKWIYALGYEKGYRDAVENGKLRYFKAKDLKGQSDAEFMAEVDKIMEGEKPQ